MLDALFLVAYTFIPFFAIRIMKKAGYPINKLSIPSFTILAIILLGYVGYIFLYFKIIDYRVSVGITNQEKILTAWMASSISIFCIILGVLISSNLYSRKYINKFTYNGIKELSRLQKVLLLFILIVSILALIAYLSKVPRIALLVSLFSLGGDLNLARSDMGNNFTGKYHWYSLFMHDFLKLITFTFYANWIIKKNIINLILFTLSFTLVSFTQIMATEKGPFAWFVIGLFMVWIILKNRSKINVKKILFIGSIIFSILIFMYINFMGSKDVYSAMLHILSRVFAGSTGSSYFYLEFFPKHQDFLMGKSFPNPAGIFPFEHYRLTVELMEWRFPEEAKNGIVGSSPSIFWTELYANFGWYGLVVPCILIGMVLYFLERFTIYLGGNVLVIGYKVWLLLHFKNLASSGISNYIMDMPLIILSLFVFILIVLPKIRIKLS